MSTHRGGTRQISWALKKVRAAALVLTLLVSAALGFGVDDGDVRRVRAFGDAVRRWQVGPEFRAVQREYVTRGVEAMRGRWFAVPAERIVLGFRSLPGLPLYLSVNESSAAHYRAFSTGELSAYLHLSGEQGVTAGVEMIESLARPRDPAAAATAPSDVEIVAFLESFRLPVKIVTDAGAVASVRRLLADVQHPPRPFVVRGDVAAALAPYVPPDLEVMTREQQAVAFRRLDDEVRRTDLELWRTKQVSDFLGGIWAQGYGQIYLNGIEWLLRIRGGARVVLAVTLVLSGWLLLRSHRPSLTGAEVTNFDRRAHGAADETE